MKLLTTSILTLIALYVIYSESFKLPTIIKKNKKLFYGLIIGLYLYYYQNNNVEGVSSSNKYNLGSILAIFVSFLFLIFAIVLIVSVSISLLKNYYSIGKKRQAEQFSLNLP